MGVEGVAAGLEVAGAAHSVVVAGASLLRPDAQTFEAMIEGWRCQQTSRQLAAATIEAATGVLRRFQSHSGEFPWRWTPAHMEEWLTDLRAVRLLAHSTVRTYQISERPVYDLATQTARGVASGAGDRGGRWWSG